MLSSRTAADFWAVLKNRRGVRKGRVYGRYPKANWRNLNIKTAFLGAGPDGPVATVRFEAMREGIEECEARIFIISGWQDRTQKLYDLAADVSATLRGP